MTQSETVIAFSTGIYENLLRVYPIAHRERFSTEMAQVFREVSREIFERNGLSGLMRLSTLFDLLKTAIEERIKETMHMDKQNFVRLSGWAYILGAIGFFVTIMALWRPEYNRYSYLSLPIDRYFQASLPVTIPSFALLFALGMLGLFLRYGQGRGRLIETALVLGVFGASLSFVVSLFWSFNANLFSEDWIVWWLGHLSHFGALVIFGITAMRSRLLPKWNAAPFLAGVSLPLAIIADLLFGVAAVQGIETLGYLIVSLTSLGLAAVGLVLAQGERMVPKPAG